MILPPEASARWRRLELLAWSFLLAYAYYPGPFGFLAWFALVRPLWIVSTLNGRAAFGAAYWFAFWFNLFSLYWVALVTPPGMVAAVVIVAFYYTAVFMLFWRLFQARPLWSMVALPFLWVGMEYFRTLSEFAFPWSDLGYTQSYYLHVMQIVATTGIHGLSFLIVVANVLLWQVFRPLVTIERRITAGAVASGVVALLVAYGWAVTPPYPEEGDMKVAILQGAVPIAVKWAPGNEQHSFDLYDSLTQAVADSTIDLAIWPETAAPCVMSHEWRCRREISRIARESRIPHLVGAQAIEGEGDQQRSYNACYQFDSWGRIGQHYYKVNLVPFSEHVPYQDYVPFMQKKFLRKYLDFIDQTGVQWWSDFYPGDTMVLFELPDASYGVIICFETTFSEYVRQYILRGAEFMVGITNDTWFGESVGIHMHSRIFVTRAIENRCWMARAANSGLSYVVDPWGRIREELPPQQPAAVATSIGRLDERSPFTLVGNVVGKASFLFTVSLVGIMALLWIVRRFVPSS